MNGPEHYNSRKAGCLACPLPQRCRSAKGERRTIYRWTQEAVLERHRARMRSKDAEGLAGHPFATLECRAGYRHCLLRGFAKVRGECSLMALCYNFTRVLNIIGFDRLRDDLAGKRAGHRLMAALQAAIAANTVLRNAIGHTFACRPVSSRGFVHAVA